MTLNMALPGLANYQLLLVKLKITYSLKPSLNQLQPTLITAIMIAGKGITPPPTVTCLLHYQAKYNTAADPVGAQFTYR